MIRRSAFTLAVVAVLALAAGLTLRALTPAPPPSVAEQAAQLDTELRCPDCQGLSVGESHTTAAAAIRTEVLAQLNAGRTPAQVRDYFVARYGEWILLEPASPLWMLIVFAVPVLGALLLVAWLWAGRRSRRRTDGAPSDGAVLRATTPPHASPGDAALRERVRDEVEALDA